VQQPGLLQSAIGGIGTGLSVYLAAREERARKEREAEELARRRKREEIFKKQTQIDAMENLGASPKAIGEKLGELLVLGGEDVETATRQVEMFTGANEEARKLVLDSLKPGRQITSGAMERLGDVLGRDSKSFERIFAAKMQEEQVETAREQVVEKYPDITPEQADYAARIENPNERNSFLKGTQQELIDRNDSLALFKHLGGIENPPESMLQAVMHMTTPQRLAAIAGFREMAAGDASRLPGKSTDERLAIAMARLVRGDADDVTRAFLYMHTLDKAPEILNNFMESTYAIDERVKDFKRFGYESREQAEAEMLPFRAALRGMMGKYHLMQISLNNQITEEPIQFLALALDELKISEGDMPTDEQVEKITDIFMQSPYFRQYVDRLPQLLEATGLVPKLEVKPPDENEKRIRQLIEFQTQGSLGKGIKVLGAAGQVAGEVGGRAVRSFAEFLQPPSPMGTEKAGRMRQRVLTGEAPTPYGPGAPPPFKPLIPPEEEERLTGR
jgi:hypothetical protein